MVFTKNQLVIMLLQLKFYSIPACNKVRLVNLSIIYFQLWWPS